MKYLNVMELKSAITSEYFSLLDTTPQFCDDLYDLYNEYPYYNDTYKIDDSDRFVLKDVDTEYTLDSGLKLPTPIKTPEFSKLEQISKDLIEKTDVDNNPKEQEEVKKEKQFPKCKSSCDTKDSSPKIQCKKENVQIKCSDITLDANTSNSCTPASCPEELIKLNQPIPSNFLEQSKHNSFEFPRTSPMYGNYFHQKRFIDAHISNNISTYATTIPINYYYNPLVFHYPPKYLNNKLFYPHSVYSTMLSNDNRRLQQSQQFRNRQSRNYYVPVITNLHPLMKKDISYSNHVVGKSVELYPMKAPPHYCNTVKRNGRTNQSILSYQRNIKPPLKTKQNTGIYSNFIESIEKQPLQPHSQNIKYPIDCSVSSSRQPSPKQHISEHQFLQGSTVSFPASFGNSLPSTSVQDNLNSEYYCNDEDLDIVSDFLAASCGDNHIKPSSENDLKAIESIKEKLIDEVSPVSRQSNEGAHDVDNANEATYSHQPTQYQTIVKCIQQDAANCVGKPNNIYQTQPTPSYLNKDRHKVMVGLGDNLLQTIERSYSSTDSDDYGLFHVRRRIMRENPASKHNMKMRKRCFNSISTVDVNTSFSDASPKKGITTEGKKIRLEIKSNRKVTKDIPSDSVVVPKKNVNISPEHYAKLESKVNKSKTKKEDEEDDKPLSQLKQQLQEKDNKKTEPLKKLIKIARPKLTFQTGQMDQNISNESRVGNRCNVVSIQVGQESKQINFADRLCIKVVKDKPSYQEKKKLPSDVNNTTGQSDAVIPRKLQQQRANSSSIQTPNSIKPAKNLTDDARPQKLLTSQLETTPKCKEIKGNEVIRSPKLIGLISGGGKKIQVVVKSRYSKKSGTHVRLGSDGQVKSVGKKTRRVKIKTRDKSLFFF